MEVSSRIEQIKIALAKQNLKYKDLSLMSNIPFSTILKVLSGNTKNPRIDTMEAIERALGIGRSEWTEEEKALGIVESVKVSVNEREMRWIQILSELDQVKGKEFTDKIVEMLETIAKK